MNEYQKQVIAPNLARLAAAINDEEAGGAEFVRNTIAFFEGNFTNFVTLRELDPGQRPAAEVDVLAFGAAVPAGKTLLWSGAALIAGTNTAVSMVR